MADTDTPPLPKGFTPISDEDAPPLPKGFTPLSQKKSSPDIFNSFSQSSATNTPVVDPALREQQHQADIQQYQQKRKQLSDAINAYKSHNGNFEQPSQDQSTIQTYKPVPLTTQAQLKARSIGANILTGIVEGTVVPAEYLNNKLGLSSDAETKRINDKISSGKGIDLGLPKSYVDNTPGMGTVNGLARILPAVLTAETSGGASFALQGVGNAALRVQQMKNEGVKFNNHSDDLMILGSGLINYALGKSVSGNVFSKLAPAVQDEVTQGLSAVATQDVAKLGADATQQDIANAYVKQAQGFATKLAQKGMSAINAIPPIATDFAGANLATTALKAGVNKLSGNKPLGDITPDEIPNDIISPLYDGSAPTNGDLGQLAKNILGSQAVGLGGLHGVLSGSMMGDHSPYKNPIIESIHSDSSPENIEKIKAAVTKQGMADGLHPDEIDNTHKSIDAVAQIAKTIPKNLPSEKFTDAVSNVLKRNQLQEELTNLRESDTEPALKDVTTPYEQLLSDKIEQANDNVKDAVTDSKTTFSKGVGEEEGKFFKTTNGEKEEITPSRYELERMERDTKQLNPTENESTNETNGSQSEGSPEETKQADEKSNGENAVHEESGVKPRYIIKGKEVTPKTDIDTNENDKNTENQEMPNGRVEEPTDSAIPPNVAQSDPTGIRNEDVAKERGENIPRPAMTHQEIDAEGKRLVDSGELNPDTFAKRIVDEKLPVTAEQGAALLYRKTQLKNRQRAILKDETPENNLANQAEFARNEDLLEQNRRATELAGNITGRSLSYRRQLMKDDYSLEHLMARAKMFNGGEDVSPEVKAKLEQHSKRIIELENKLLDREDEIRKLQDKTTVSDVKRNAEFEERKAKRTTTKASLRKEREDLLADLHIIAKKSLGNLGANKIPVEMLVPLAKLARNYVLDGAVTISAVADKIYQDIKDSVPGVDKSDIEDAIKDGFEKSLREHNEQRLANAKKRQLTKLEELKSGNYEKKVYSKIQVDNDYLKIRAEINREQTKINKQIADVAYSQRGAWSKAGQIAVKYGRQAKLASITVIGKLAAAGLTTAAMKPITEGAGKFWSTILPTIAKKSIVEGSVSRSKMLEAAEKTGSVKNFAQAYARAAFKGMEDASKELNIKKGGQSDLSALYGKNPIGKLPAEAAEFFGHVHSAIKAPIKRFAWEHSYAKRVAKGIEMGIDVTDPVVDAKNRLDAYKDGERAIFMADNKVSSIYETAVKSLENSKSSTSRAVGNLARILFPFVKVPTNIVLSSGRYAFGLIPGISKLAQVGSATALKMAGAEKLAGMIHKGMGKLTPEESDIVLRNLKHGSVGGMALALGFFNPNVIGGYYQPGEKRDPSDVEADQVGKLPIWMTEHPIFQAMQIGSTFRRLLDAHEDKDNKVPASVLGTAAGIAENIPLAEGAKQITEALNSDQKMTKLLSGLIKGEIEPAAIQQLATITDTENGAAVSFNPENQTKRRPEKGEGFTEHLKQDLELGIPGLRKNVPEYEP